MPPLRASKWHLPRTMQLLSKLFMIFFFTALLALAIAAEKRVVVAKETNGKETTKAKASNASRHLKSSKGGDCAPDVMPIFTSEDIEKLLPHRHPFVFVDKVVEYEPGKRAVGIKCVTKNEEFFQGHFPGRPVMPGVLQVEALAQLAAIVSLQMEGAEPGAAFFFAGVDGVKWKKPVVPGDTLVMEIEIKKWNARFGLAKATGRAYVDGVVAIEVDEMTFAFAK